MTLREHITNLSDRELAEILIKEESYEDYDEDYDDVCNPSPSYTITNYKTTDGVLFDLCYGFNSAVEHQIELLNSEYKEEEEIEY